MEISFHNFLVFISASRGTFGIDLIEFLFKSFLVPDKIFLIKINDSILPGGKRYPL